MARDINKVILLGNVGKDPEIKTFSNGGKIASFSIATSNRYKTKDGEQKEQTEWHRVSVKAEGLVNLVEQYVQKGTRLYIEGEKWTREYEKDGATERICEIVLNPFRSTIAIQGRAKGDDDVSRGERGNAPPPAKDDLDDEIPF